MRYELWIEEVSFLVHVTNKNGFIVNTLEQEQVFMSVLKLSIKNFWVCGLHR